LTVYNFIAPKNFIIKLKFEDNFQLEPSNNCIYDYVEVRNGPHGYSPFVGRFCGKESPPEITSSGRELWIRFNSDETIELNGFRIVYEFIPVPTSEYFYDANIYQRKKILGEIFNKEGIDFVSLFFC
jgi:hypothetical protein